MTREQLEFLKSHTDQVLEIETRSGERLLIKTISVFDKDYDPDIFFWLVNEQLEENRSEGYALQLDEIVSVKSISQD
jgi:hypothetical protein